MTNKKGVIMYYDILDQLEDFTDEQFGKITRAIIKYDKTGETTEFDDLSMKIAFKMLKPILDRNKQEYDEMCAKRREAGSLGGKQKVANATKCYQMLPNDSKSTYKDNDIDKDIDIEKESIEKKAKKFSPPSLQEVEDYARTKNRVDLAKPFYDYFTEGNWKDGKGNKVRNWKQKLITWISHDSKNNSKFSTARQYTRDEMNSMFQNIDEIEI